MARDLYFENVQNAIPGPYRKGLILVAAVLTCFIGNAQHPNIKISDKAAPNEISIALNPADLSKMMAAANIASVYTSVDGGLTWNRKKQESIYGVWGDPVVAIDSMGNYFHFHLSRPDAGKWLDRIVCQKSTNGGISFNQGSYAGLSKSKQQDKHWVVIDPVSKNMYLTWTQFDDYESADPDDHSNILFSKSTNQGKSWSKATQINSISGDCLDGDSTVEGAVPAVGPHGEIYVSWAGPNGLAFNKSLDGGRTWLKHETRIDSIAGGWAFDISGIYRANGMPITKCDLSNGPNRGVIYVNWADDRNGNKDIFLAKSTDGGKSWSETIKVNQDTSERDQFFTWMDIDQSNGNLYFVYHDRRNHPGDSTDVYLTYSTDGGSTFHDVKLSATPFLPHDSIFFGDYNTIAASNGVVRPAWTRLDGDQLSVWTAIVETQTLLNPKNKKLEVDYAGGRLELAFHGKLAGNLTLFDLNGHPIYSTKKIKIDRKPSTVQLESELIPGVYAVRIENKKEKFERQLVVEY